MRKILFDGITVDDFLEIIRETVRNEIQHAGEGFPAENQSKYLSRDEACSELHISLPTFHRWCKQGKLKVHKAGGRILVKKTDIDAAVQEIQNLKYRSPP